MGWKGAASLQEVSTEGWSRGCGWQWACRAQHLDTWLALKVSHRHSQYFQGQAQEGAHPQPRGPGRSYDGGTAAMGERPCPQLPWLMGDTHRGSQVSLDSPRCPRALSYPAGVGKVDGKCFLGSLSSRLGCQWLTAHRGQVPGGRHCVQAASASFSLGRACPAQASGSCRPAASRGALGSCPVLGSGEQASSPEVPVLPLRLKGGWSPGRDHVGQADLHPHRQWEEQAPPRSLASRSVSLLVLEGWVLPGASAHPPTPPAPALPLLLPRLCLISAVPGMRERLQ